MIELHYSPSTAAMVPHILLEEIGTPYQRVLVDRAAGAHKRPDYLQLNPNGLIPVLVDGEHVFYETAAIARFTCATRILRLRRVSRRGRGVAASRSAGTLPRSAR